MVSPSDYALKALRRPQKGPYSLQKKNNADRNAMRALQPPRQRNAFAGGPYNMSRREQRLRGYVGGLALGKTRP